MIWAITLGKEGPTSRRAMKSEMTCGRRGERNVRRVFKSVRLFQAEKQISGPDGQPPGSRGPRAVCIMLADSGMTV